MIVNEVKIDFSRSIDGDAQCDLPDTRPIMCVDTAHHVGHRRKDHDIADAARSLNLGQNERLSLHTACIADNWNSRGSDDPFGCNRSLCELLLVRIPTTSRIIRRSCKPRHHAGLTHSCLRTCNQKSTEQEAYMEKLPVSRHEISQVRWHC